MVGTTSGLVRRFHGAVIEQLPDVSRERMVYLSDHRAEMAQILSRAFEIEVQSYAITVNYKLTVEQMVAALGCDGYVNLNINTENFGKEVAAKKGVEEKLEVVLFHFNRDATSDEVLAEMDRLGLRPATMAELCAFGAKYPEKQREFPIAALGSSCVLDALHQVAALWSRLSERFLYLDHLVRRWAAHWRFLAVRK